MEVFLWSSAGYCDILFHINKTIVFSVAKVCTSDFVCMFFDLHLLRIRTLFWENGGWVFFECTS